MLVRVSPPAAIHTPARYGAAGHHRSEAPSATWAARPSGQDTGDGPRPVPEAAARTCCPRTAAARMMRMTFTGRP